jgi:hypothetical protein
MNAIPNVYDGPGKPVRPLETPHFSLDFAYSDNAREMDSGIRESIRGVKLSILAMGIALYRMQESGLYTELSFSRFGQYVDKLADDTNMTRQNIYNWVYIGQAYVKFRAELERVGFDDADGPTKLPFLGRALENHSKREVFRNVKDMSKRQFITWALAAPGIKNDKKHKSVKIKGDQVLVGHDLLATFTDAIDPDERRYYENLLLAGAQARAEGEVIRIYRFYDEDEARRYDRVHPRTLKALRTK